MPEIVVLNKKNISKEDNGDLIKMSLDSMEGYEA